MSSPKCAVARCRWIAVFGLMVSGFVLAAPASGQQKEATPPATAPPAAPAPTAAPVSGSPVIVNGKTLFVIQEGYFAFTADARATAIEARIENLSRLPQSRIAAIRTYDEESTTAIADGTQVIMTITEKDAQAAKRSRTELAADYAQRIRVAAEALRKQYSLKTLVIAALWALLATGVLLGLLKLFSMAFKALNRGIKSWHGKYIRSIRIQKLELLPAARITALLLLLSRLLRAALVLVALYLYISVTFSLFPWTQGYTNILMGYVTYPLNRVSEAFLSFVPNLFFIAVILLVAYYVTKAVRFLFEAVEKESITIPGFYRDWARPTYKIARFLICAFTLVIVFPYLPGSKSPAFQGVSIFFGLLLSLGSSSAVSNVVAGTVLTYTRAFQLGDRVKIGETIGDVIEKTLLVTRVRTIKNVDISIPNSMVLGSHIVNYSSGDDAHRLILHTSVTIGYDAPWRVVHQLLLDAALGTENILKDPKPFIYQTSLDDFYVSYQLNAFTDVPAVMARTYSDLHQNIQDKFNEAGVEITSPHFRSMRDGNAMAIPETYLPKNYEAPPFRVLPVNEGTKEGTKEGRKKKDSDPSAE